MQSGLYIETYFPEHEVRFVAILDNIDTAYDTSNNDIAPFKSILNEMYAKDTSKKINSVLQSKRNLGEYLGTAPYGYKKDPENKYHLIIDEEAANVIASCIFSTFIQSSSGKSINFLDLKLTFFLCYDCKGYIGIRSPDKNGNIYGRCQRYGRFGKFDVCSPHNFSFILFAFFIYSSSVIIPASLSSYITSNFLVS